MNIRRLMFVGIFAISITSFASGETGSANTTTPKSKSWWSMGGSAKKEVIPEADINDKETISKTVVIEQNRKVLNREEKAYFRRLEACDRLMQIAITNNDNGMQEKIITLQEKIQAVYNRKTSNLQLPAQMPNGNSLTELNTNLDKDVEKLLAPSSTKSNKNQSAQRKDN
ncbi:MAG: hypothetical protein EBT92_00480 [Planctomycetes bacterium]|nr:hypothetical protein [Planctomycetota bacterium]